MFAEIAGSLAALKESFNLVKVINEAKTDAEIKGATFELQRKLQDIQLENLKLIELITNDRAKIAELQKKVDNIDLFDTQSKNYEGKKILSGAFVYLDKRDTEIAACPTCFSKRKIFMLHPIQDYCILDDKYFLKYKCYECDSVFPFKVADD
ncbi:hypothetical protein [Morganella morganii]|uniref:hypothetical protein n=1 Tax=Morganella morganii TaxID=582 RepID=UPI00236855AA|nr:hypothetical protein [Morganella morganii]